VKNENALYAFFLLFDKTKQTKQANETNHIMSQPISTHFATGRGWLFYAKVGVVCFATGAGLEYLLIRSKFCKSSF
jgi:hypothetical protein